MRKLFFILICVASFFRQGLSQTGPAIETPVHILSSADSLYYLHDWNAAKELYKKYLADSSQNSIAWNRLGFCCQNLGQYDEAMHSYELSLANKPGGALQGTVSYRISKLYAAQNKKNEALDWLDKAVQQGFINIAEMDSSRDFIAIRNDPRFRELYKKMVATAFPCTANQKAREFDFWIGEWDVYQTGTQNRVGHSLVQNVAGDCAILENWTSLSGQSGKSINYYNPATGKWEQDWMGSDGAPQRYLEGEYKDTALRFTYEAVQNGQKTIGHFIFYNLGKDKVRQFQDMSVDGGKTFSVSYDFTYIRKHS